MSVTNHLEKSTDNSSGGVASNLKMAEEHSLALLRSLGPVQEQPMDLSVRVIEIKSRRKSKTSQRIKNEEDSKGETTDEEAEAKDEISDALENNDENFNKRKNPLDLTKPPKLEI